VPVTFFAATMMLFLPIVFALFTSVENMIPFTHAAPTAGMFGLGSLAELYFLLSAVHGVRLWRRMIDPTRGAAFAL